MQHDLALSNAPEFSVSDLAFSLKKTLEETYGRIRIRGEFGRLTFHGSGHMYGNIKDDKASIDVVCWRSTLPRLSVRPEEGLEVIATGRISTYPARSNYQLIIESVELAGEGALLKMLEERRKKLAHEGLFAPSQKQPIPFLPQRIGVITSPTGAVIRDILQRLQDRFPLQVYLWSVRVQGNTAATEIIRAIEGFQQLEPPIDTLILARGGGSLEDLMPFNEEGVVRTVAQCRIPIITAVGHETDTSLVDYAADLRAPTPTAAAEQAVPVRAELLSQVRDNAQRLHASQRRQIDAMASRLESVRLAEPERLFELKAQALDYAAHKLLSSYEKALSVKSDKIMTNYVRLRHPQQLVEEKSRHLQFYDEPLSRLQITLLTSKEQQLSNLARMLENLSFQNVLKRGFVVVRDGQSACPISEPSKITSGQDLRLQYKDDQAVEVITK